mgnify:CR=1 FL=1|tara:strand:+ start:3866 stop:4984 length:1119 start_codon:yes stop_codon:yes gene_type:complete
MNKVYDKSESILNISKKNDNKVNAYQLIKQILKTNNDSEINSKFLNFIDQKKEYYTYLDKPHIHEEIVRCDSDKLFEYLLFRYKYEIFPRKRILEELPPLVQIEPSSICNYRCVFCYQTDPRLSNKKNGHMGLMSLDLYKKIIDQIEGRIEGVTLASRGDPSVNKALGDMLLYSANKFTAFKLNTNAFLMNEKLCHDILSSNIQTLVYSADAANPDLYKKLRVNGNLDRVIENVKNFNDIKSKHYPKSKIITRVSGVKYTQEQNFEEQEIFWRDLVDQVVFVDYNPWENVYNSKLTGVNDSCSDLWRRIFIWWDGKVAPCDVDYLTTLFRFSNITLNNISEIWNSEEYNSLREQHLNNKRNCISPCNRCSVV